jgi:hypothetical protein
LTSSARAKTLSGSTASAFLGAAAPLPASTRLSTVVPVVPEVRMTVALLADWTSATRSGEVTTAVMVARELARREEGRLEGTRSGV